MPWFSPFCDPIILPNAKALVSTRDLIDAIDDDAGKLTGLADLFAISRSKRRSGIFRDRHFAIQKPSGFSAHGVPRWTAVLAWIRSFRPQAMSPGGLDD